MSKVYSVELNVSCFEGSSKSKKGQDALIAQTGASKDDADVITYTFPRDKIKPIKTACQALRLKFDTWGLNGKSKIFINKEAYGDLKKKVAKEWEGVQKLIDEIWTEENYNKMVEGKRQSMQDLFDQTKIKTLDQVRNEYGYHLEPTAVSLESLSDDPIDQDQLESCKDNIKEGLNIQVDLLRSITQRIIENMEDETKRSKCTFKAVQRVSEAVRNMNIFNNPTVTSVINKIDSIFNGHDSDDFKDNASLRQSVIEKAKRIMGEIDTIVVDQEMKDLFKDAEVEDPDLV